MINWSLTHHDVKNIRQLIAIYSTVIKYPLFHEKTRDILFFERPQGARKIKFREFSREIKGFITVEYVVLFNEADGQDTF